ncbi:hypothetical protein CO173_03460 [Candidatus Uhrbacteria bacterium CG_4_9_14_3_um_filter_41_35]|uniref:Prepilin peptidase n=1 Tax=Candidatus Uhrbacteria bacterium CG_4_9_14_3_um_filter_41_35 TaxID=1975034 RepID=A0A2M7XEA2_9BACT|nr:MAG: hypothetical protein COV92_01495 [Candidatus Uhrbacteria bacterium CG11_big_fil_rev_8_21_14_0_20_41_9]PJA46172.1 MAG: hypothetical protein CO173_03460 [Candidatus Uhrbacteria bacterium CG_4_9_14_3_um_filter_41_35]
MTDLIIWTILASLLGIIFGSFINVVVFRTKEGQSLGGRSKCRTCLEPIGGMDLIPIVSYFALKGRCRRCSSVIEWQYPAVEMATGILFGLLFARAWLGIGWPNFIDQTEWVALFVRDASIAIFLVIIFVYDFRYSYILDKYSIPAILLALVFNVALGANALSLLLGGLLIGGFFAIQFLVSEGKWIGGGDIRMGLLMGFLLGPALGGVALFVSYVLGALTGIFLILTKQRELNSHVPFGTFLALGTVIAMIWGSGLLNWYLGYF